MNKDKVFNAMFNDIPACKDGTMNHSYITQYAQYHNRSGKRIEKCLICGIVVESDTSD